MQIGTVIRTDNLARRYGEVAISRDFNDGAGRASITIYLETISAEDYTIGEHRIEIEHVLTYDEVIG